jgi:hypothetical protein
MQVRLRLLDQATVPGDAPIVYWTFRTVEVELDIFVSHPSSKHCFNEGDLLVLDASRRHYFCRAPNYTQMLALKFL